MKAFVANQFNQNQKLKVKKKIDEEFVDENTYVVVGCKDGIIRVYSWDEWRLIYKTLSLKEIEYGSLKRNNKELYELDRYFYQHPQNSNIFYFYEFKLDLNDLFQGVPANNIYIKKLHEVLINNELRSVYI